MTSANPSFFKRPSSLSSPLAIATINYTQNRLAATTAIPENEANAILVAQRRNRPISPHLAIYRPQITWYASGLTRLTGLTLSGTFYLFGAAYLVAPLLGWHLESASLAAAFASLSPFTKMGLKAFFALPFTFHTFNGIRHLIWDLGYQFSIKQVIVSGWTVVGLSVVSALGLTFLV